MMYTVQATRNGKQLPTFFLDADIQGIVDEDHAYQIAKYIVGYHDQTIELSVASR